MFAVVYNVPRYFESTLVWNATEDVGYFDRTSLGSSILYTRHRVVLRRVVLGCCCWSCPWPSRFSFCQVSLFDAAGHILMCMDDSKQCAFVFV